MKERKEKDSSKSAGSKFFIFLFFKPFSFDPEMKKDLITDESDEEEEREMGVEEG